jgi:hypothetical protein
VPLHAPAEPASFVRLADVSPERSHRVCLPAGNHRDRYQQPEASSADLASARSIAGRRPGKRVQTALGAVRAAPQNTSSKGAATELHRQVAASSGARSLVGTVRLRADLRNLIADSVACSN